MRVESLRPGHMVLIAGLRRNRPAGLFRSYLPMAVKTVTSEQFRGEVLESETPVVVDFYADWCGPCHRVAPVLEELAERWAPYVKVVRVDTEAEPELWADYRMSRIPALLLFRNGKVAAWTLGAKPGDLIQKQLRIKPGSSSAGWMWGGLLWRLKSWFS